MTHDLINYEHEKNQKLVNQLCQQLAILGGAAKTAGASVQSSVESLSGKIENLSNSTDKQANRMYWLTWALVGATALNAAAIIFQTYHR